MLHKTFKKTLKHKTALASLALACLCTQPLSARAQVAALNPYPDGAFGQTSPDEGDAFQPDQAVIMELLARQAERKKRAGSMPLSLGDANFNQPEQLKKQRHEGLGLKQEPRVQAQQRQQLQSPQRSKSSEIVKKQPVRQRRTSQRDMRAQSQAVQQRQYVQEEVTPQYFPPVRNLPSKVQKPLPVPQPAPSAAAIARSSIVGGITARPPVQRERSNPQPRATHVNPPIEAPKLSEQAAQTQRQSQKRRAIEYARKSERTIPITEWGKNQNRKPIKHNQPEAAQQLPDPMQEPHAFKSKGKPQSQNQVDLALKDASPKDQRRQEESAALGEEQSNIKLPAKFKQYYDTANTTPAPNATPQPQHANESVVAQAVPILRRKKIVPTQAPSMQPAYQQGASNAAKNLVAPERKKLRVPVGDMALPKPDRAITSEAPRQLADNQDTAIEYRPEDYEISEFAAKVVEAKPKKRDVEALQQKVAMLDDMSPSSPSYVHEQAMKLGIQSQAGQLIPSVREADNFSGALPSGLAEEIQKESEMIKSKKIEQVMTKAPASIPVQQQSEYTAPPLQASPVPEVVLEEPSLSKSNVTQVPQWMARKGESAYKTLAQWARNAGVDLIWNSQFLVDLHADIALTGSFEEAVQEVLLQYQGLNAGVHGSLFVDDVSGKKTLVIETNRT